MNQNIENSIIYIESEYNLYKLCSKNIALTLNSKMADNENL